MASSGGTALARNISFYNSQLLTHFTVVLMLTHRCFILTVTNILALRPIWKNLLQMLRSWRTLFREEYGDFLVNEEHIQVIFSYFVFLSELRIQLPSSANSNIYLLSIFSWMFHPGLLEIITLLWVDIRHELRWETYSGSSASLFPWQADINYGISTSKII